MNMESLKKFQGCGSVCLMFMFTYAVCSSVNILFLYTCFLVVWPLVGGTINKYVSWVLNDLFSALWLRWHGTTAWVISWNADTVDKDFNTFTTCQF